MVVVNDGRELTRKINQKKKSDVSQQKERAVNRCLLILDLKPFRSLVKEKYSRELQSLAV